MPEHRQKPRLRVARLPELGRQILPPRGDGSSGSQIPHVGPAWKAPPSPHLRHMDSRLSPTD